MKKIQKKRWIAMILAAAMAGAMMTGCGAGTGPEGGTSSVAVKEVSLEEIHQAVKDAYGENYLPSMEFTPEEIEEKFGLTEDMVEEVFAEGPMISAHVDTLIEVKAKEGKGEEVEQVLNDYRTKMIEESFTYPMNMPKQETSVVFREGDYVFFVMLGAYAEDEEITSSEEKTKAFYEEQVQIGVDAIRETLGVS